jgi:hypothetical protein
LFVTCFHFSAAQIEILQTQLTAKTTEYEQAILAHVACAAQLEATTTRVKDLEASQGSNFSDIEERLQQLHASHAQEMSVLLEKWQLDKVSWSTQLELHQVWFTSFVYLFLSF